MDKDPFQKKKSYRSIKKTLENDGIAVSIGSISNVIRNIGERRIALVNNEKFKISRKRLKRTKAMISKVRRFTSDPNPPSQYEMAKKLMVSQRTINKIIHEDLAMVTRRKSKVHKLTEKHMKNRKTNCRKLYENHLAGERSEFVVTLDEAFMYLSYCNGKSKICYVKRGEKTPEDWIYECEKSFPNGFMVVAALCGRGTLPLLRVPNNTKVNSQYYINFVLKPILEEYIPQKYSGELKKVFLHHDKCTSHTSKLTQQYLESVKARLGINFIENKDIPIKSPDASPMDFYGFGHLKQSLLKRHPKTKDGLWKVLNNEWSKVSPQLVTKVFNNWKLRCRLIVKNQGKHIEQTRTIHRRKLKK